MEATAVIGLIFALAYVGDFVTVAAYLYLARTGRITPYHVVNAICAAPILATEIITHSGPILILTVFYLLVACYGLVRGNHERTR